MGMILTSLFATTTANSTTVDGAFYGHAVELGKCLLVLVIIVPFFLAATWLCLWVTDKLIALRVSGEMAGWVHGRGVLQVRSHFQPTGLGLGCPRTPRLIISWPGQTHGLHGGAFKC